MENAISENDIPGAKFIHKTVEEHTNIQLKRWLKCRGLSTTGKRSNLIERCQTALKANVDIDPKIDGGKWHVIKSTPVSKEVPILPISGWKKFPSVRIPKNFNSGHIYHYLVDSVTSVEKVCDLNSDDSDEDDLHTSKPLTKGKNLFRTEVDM